MKGCVWRDPLGPHRMLQVDTACPVVGRTCASAGRAYPSLTVSNWTIYSFITRYDTSPLPTKTFLDDLPNIPVHT